MKKIIFLSLAIVLVFSGCESLDEFPKSSLSPTNFYLNPAQVESAFAASMNKLWSYWGVYDNGYGAGYFFAEDDHNWNSQLAFDSYTGNNIWGAHYGALANINAALYAVLNGTTKGTEEELDLLEGQARFLRAFNYFYLVRLYGKVPLYTEGENPIVDPEPRASIEDVYAQIVNDLTIASAKLPSSWPENRKGRPANTAAMGLLAKVYLTMATAPLNQTDKFELAATEAKKVMNSGIELVSDVNNVFSMDNRYNQEWMFSFNSAPDDKSTPVDTWAPSELPWEGWADIIVADSFALHFPDQPRKYAYLQCYNEDSVYYLNWQAGYPRPAVRKYMYADMDDYYAYLTWYNAPILRYADVLLIYAEAANQVNNGPTQEAVDAINKVIDRANGDNGTEERATISMAKDDFNRKVIQERSWELCWEFDRWFDLLRTRTLEQEMAANKPFVSPNYNERLYLLPIPFIDLRQNPLLLPNNPGWPDSE